MPLKYNKKSDFKAPWEKTRDEVKGWTQASREGTYYSTRWLNLRASILSDEPFCRRCACKDKPKISGATVVDHILPVYGSEDLNFWDVDNLQPLCYTCHRIKTNIDSGKGSEINLKKGKDLMNDLES